MQTPFTWYPRRRAQHGCGPGRYAGDRPARAGVRRAHLLNFGSYATPERRVIFDINDLDETLPASWEWDVKRLTASFVWPAVTTASVKTALAMRC